MKNIKQLTMTAILATTIIGGTFQANAGITLADNTLRSVDTSKACTKVEDKGLLGSIIEKITVLITGETSAPCQATDSIQKNGILLSD